MLKSPQNAVRLLVVLHVAAGLVAACCTNADAVASVVGFFAVVFAQTGLMGILASLAPQSLRARLIETVIGLAYLCLLACFTIPRDVPMFCLLLAICTLVVAGVLAILRRRGVVLRVVELADRATLDEPVRFGIRHLMAWMLATAVLLRIGQSLDPRGTLGVLFSYGLSFAVVPIVAPWAALGSKHAAARGIILLLAAALAGGIVPSFQGTPRTEELPLFISVTVAQSLILLLSLALLRPSGVRLVRDRISSAEIQAAGGIEHA